MKSINRLFALLLATSLLVAMFCIVPVSAASNEQTIYDYLTKTMKLNTAAACGVLANISAESGFNPNVWGDNNTSYGICQWHNGRLTNLKNYCSQNGYSWTSLSGQLHFLEYELGKSYPSVLTKLKSVANSASGAYDAGYYWCYNYEVPADRANKSVTRGNTAKTTYWNRYGSGTATSTSSTSGDYYPACSSSYTSIVDALKSIGVDNSLANRKLIAAANGISGYSGTATQNTQMLNLLKQGKLKKSGTTTSSGVSYYPKCSSSYTSIVDGLKSIGVDSSLANRKVIAAKNGISNYTGTAAQNTQLLNLLKAGTLKRP